MNDEQILEKLKEIIIDIKEEDIKIEANTALVEGNIFDSLELINYLTQIEEVFGINITFDELVENKLGLVENMIKYLAERQN